MCQDVSGYEAVTNNSTSSRAETKHAFSRVHDLFILGQQVKHPTLFPTVLTQDLG